MTANVPTRRNLKSGVASRQAHANVAKASPSSLEERKSNGAERDGTRVHAGVEAVFLAARVARIFGRRCVSRAMSRAISFVPPILACPSRTIVGKNNIMVKGLRAPRAR